ncbi:MAG: hypothetical protein HEQ38_02795 [Gemmatimonas sp.]|nr:hypothetical protein [Gemmatimonas sp.]
MQTISLTLKLELTLVVITALLIWRMWRVYPGQALRDLAMGWSLWGVRFLLSIVGTMAVTVGAAAHMPARRLLTAAAMGVSFASAIYMYGGVLQVAGIRGSVEPLRRSVVRAVPWLVLLALITTYEGVPDWWRLTMLLVSSTLVYVVTFGVLSWTLLRRPKGRAHHGASAGGVWLRALCSAPSVQHVCVRFCRRAEWPTSGVRRNHRPCIRVDGYHCAVARA